MSELKCPESIKYTQISKTTRASHGLVYLKKSLPGETDRRAQGQGPWRPKCPQVTSQKGPPTASCQQPDTAGLLHTTYEVFLFPWPTPSEPESDQGP